MERICCIISAGDVNQKLLKSKKNEYDCFIGADLGYQKALELGIEPTILVGDLDSLGHFPVTQSNITLIRHPVEKDLSDTHLALEEGIKLGYNTFHVYGALGGKRLSHSLSNIQTLVSMKNKNVHVTLMGENETVSLLKNESLTLNLPKNTSFSVFSLSDTSLGVSITGSKYTLSNTTLSNDYPLGLSNESTEKETTISVKDGCLLLIIEN